jgi:ankyrin repeat protein
MESDGEPMFNNKVDIWAIGCIIYELATGTRAFKNDWEVFQYRSSGTTMEVVLDDEFDAHSKTSITKLVGDMLQIEPSARPSASVLSTYFFNSIRRLEELSHQPPVQFTSGVSPAPPSTITDETKHIRRSPRKRQRTQDELEVPRKKSRQAPPSLPLYQIVPVQSSGKDVDVKESKDGVNVEARADVNRNTNTLNLALREASVRGDLADVRSLLEKGADVNAEFGDRSNALCSAVSRGHETVAELLLDKGANPDGRARSGKAALHIAAVTGPDHLVRLLLEKGAKVNIQGRDKKTPLHNASTWRKEAIVRLLLEKGADVNALDEYLETPLHGASTAGHEEVVRLLLEKGARIDAAGKFGNTPLDNAAEYGHKKVVRLLLSNGARISNAKGVNGDRNPLYQASTNGHKAVVQLLLENGADVNAQGRFYDDSHARHNNALEGALANGHDAVVQLLLQYGAKHSKLW